MFYLLRNCYFLVIANTNSTTSHNHHTSRETAAHCKMYGVYTQQLIKRSNPPSPLQDCSWLHSKFVLQTTLPAEDGRTWHALQREVSLTLSYDKGNGTATSLPHHWFTPQFTRLMDEVITLKPLDSYQYLDSNELMCYICNSTAKNKLSPLQFNY